MSPLHSLLFSAGRAAVVLKARLRFLISLPGSEKQGRRKAPRLHVSSCSIQRRLFLPAFFQPKLLFIYYYASECGKLGHFEAKIELLECLKNRSEVHFYTGAQCVCVLVCMFVYLHSKCAFVSHFKETDKSKTAW